MHIKWLRQYILWYVYFLRTKQIKEPRKKVQWATYLLCEHDDGLSSDPQEACPKATRGRGAYNPSAGRQRCGDGWACTHLPTHRTKQVHEGSSNRTPERLLPIMQIISMFVPKHSPWHPQTGRVRERSKLLSHPKHACSQWFQDILAHSSPSYPELDFKDFLPVQRIIPKPTSPTPGPLHT